MKTRKKKNPQLLVNGQWSSVKCSSQMSNVKGQLFSKSGFAIVEIVVASAVIAVALFGLLGAGQYYLRLARDTNRNVQAQALLEEGLEALRSMRDESYAAQISPLSTSGTTYYLYWNGSLWRSTTTTQLVSGLFTRSFSVAAVSRDVNDEIVSSGGTNDPNTRKFTVSVTWLGSNGSTSQKTISEYLTNYFNN